MSMSRGQRKHGCRRHRGLRSRDDPRNLPRNRSWWGLHGLPRQAESAVAQDEPGSARLLKMACYFSAICQIGWLALGPSTRALTARESKITEAPSSGNDTISVVSI